MATSRRRREPSNPGVTRATEPRVELNRTLRLAFFRGAERQSQLHHGRPLADDELRHALVEYPGDLTADSGAVPSLSPTPTFFGHPVLVDYPRGLRNAHAIHRAICATVAQAEDGHAKVVQLVAGIQEAAATFGCTARVIGRTPGVIEFTVTRD